MPSEPTFQKGLPPLKRGSYIVNYLEWRGDQYGDYRVSSTAWVFRDCDGDGGSRLQRRGLPDISSGDVVEWAWHEHQPTEADLAFMTLNWWTEHDRKVCNRNCRHSKLIPLWTPPTREPPAETPSPVYRSGGPGLGAGCNADRPGPYQKSSTHGGSVELGGKMAHTGYRY